MKNLFCLFLVFCFANISLAQSSGAVVKGGLIWNDYLRDDQTILQRSQTGSVVGLEVRLGADDNSYFKLGGYYGRIHMQPQDHPKQTQFFKVVDGYNLLKAICGIEVRLVTQRNFNWRLAASGAFSFIAGVRGNVLMDDLSSGMFGVHLSTGVDVSIFSLDIALEPGLNDFLRNTEDTKPVMMMMTLGFHF